MGLASEPYSGLFHTLIGVLAGPDQSAFSARNLIFSECSYPQSRVLSRADSPKEYFVRASWKKNKLFLQDCEYRKDLCAVPYTLCVTGEQAPSQVAGVASGPASTGEHFILCKVFILCRFMFSPACPFQGCSFLSTCASVLP